MKQNDATNNSPAPNGRVSLGWLAIYKPYEGLARLFCLLLKWLPDSALPRVRFLRSASERIGHLAIEPDIFVKELRLGLRPPGDYRWVTRPGKVCNPCLLDYWREYLKIYDRGPGRFFLLPFARQRRLGIELNEPIIADQKTVGYARVQTQWGDRPPLLELREEHRRRGEAALARLGLPPEAWFVCVHNREPGYLPAHKYGDDYRNADIMSLVPAMEEIIRRGGWCVRMGDPSMAPLPPMKGVIDYAHSPAKSDWLDIYLCASNRFFLGCTSGLGLVASVFGKPVAQANAAPFSTILYYGRKDLGIAKLYVDAATGRVWSFPEIFGQTAANFRRGADYAGAGLLLRDNTTDEIVDLVLDMFDQIEGRAPVPGDAEREKRFLALMKPGHYAYGAPARVSPRFLRRHGDLLG